MAPAEQTRAVKAHAKLNVRLDVLDAQVSGLHCVRSIVGELALADDITVEPSAGEFSVECVGADVAQTDNVAWRAAQALRLPLPALRVHIRKHIPLEAGLGGGSADAAALLKTVAHVLALNGNPIPHERLLRAAAGAGSDVPACLYAGFKLVEGTGDRVRPLDVRAPSWGVVLLQPPGRVSTAAAYAMLDAARARSSAVRPPPDDMSGLCAALTSADLVAACARMRNDFEPVIQAAFPDIAGARQRLRNAGASGTILCGSGSCVAGFYPTLGAAESAAAAIHLQSGDWIAVTQFIDER
jgi:4-diphosphocytidyl-2-C-methyl-D-erythritol kinase